MQQEEKTEQFINESEMELNIATKHRAVSLEVRKTKQPTQATLPQIGGLPGIANDAPSGSNRPVIVLPHSEPLSEE